MGVTPFSDKPINNHRDLLVMSTTFLSLQSMMAAILQYWNNQGCVVHQGYDLEVGAGTFNPATFLNALGPEPYKVAYVEPSRRPQDGRYGMHPNRLQKYHQLQVLLKPVPKNFLQLYLESLKVIGLNLQNHDIRFVHDDWENPTIGAWGLGWEVWLNGMEITQLTYFQAVGSKPLDAISGEITYGIERIAMYLQKKNSVYDIMWNDTLTYGEIIQASEQAWSRYNFEAANTQMWLKHFEDFAEEVSATLEQGLPLPAYDFVIKASHAFNILDSRGVISVTERTRYIARIRQLARAVADAYVQWRHTLNYPLLHKQQVETVDPVSPETPVITQPATYLLEIGSEELPASFVPIGLQQLETLAKKLLAEQGISYSKIEVLGSPRRLALLIDDLEPEVIQKAFEKKGPAVSSLFTESGEVSPQGKQFFATQNVMISCQGDLQKYTQYDIRSINGNDYLFLIHPEVRKETASILQEELPKLILSMKFPKKMTWDSSKVEYARPIRWLVSLYGTDIVPFSFGTVQAGNVSWGHRQLDPRSIVLSSSTNYVEALREACVIVSQKERREIIEHGLQAHSSESIFPIPHSRLLEETTYLTEHPFVSSAHFDEKFCDLPKELLIAEMINHQKYFPTQQSSGKLHNAFIVVCDNSPNDVIVEGNEKALTPRLTDGHFLFHQDLNTPLSVFVEKLRSVTYIEPLGSLYEKVERLKQHVVMLYPLLPLCAKEDILAAVEYCKADLVSAVVNEFPELQGIMGSYYLKHAGFSSAAATAVGEHLQHITDGKMISTTGVLLSLVDRLDNLLACFILGLSPTSSHDPYALRRQSLEILTLLHASEASLDLADLLRSLAKHFPNVISDEPVNKENVVEEILSFIWGRLKTFLNSLAIDKDVIASVLPTFPGRNPIAIINACQAMQTMKKQHQDQLTRITATHNRLKKILASLTFSITEEKIEELGEEEQKLKFVLETFEQANKVTDLDYFLALSVLAEQTNHFLDSVRIADSNDQVKNLRIALLMSVMKAFSYYSWEALRLFP